MPSRHDAPAMLDEVRAIIERHRVLESLAERQRTDKRELLTQMQKRENLVELRRRLAGVHPADLASMIARLPPDERLLVVHQLAARDVGLTLVELDPEIRAAVIDDLDRQELEAALAELDADDLAYLADSVPAALIDQASASLDGAGRSWVADTSSHASGTVGRLMRQDVVALRGELTVAQAIDALRQGGELPPQTDRLFVTDARHMLRGAVPLATILRAAPDAPLASIASTEVAAFRPGDSAAEAAKAFERYDWVSAPMVDDLGKLIGRITIDAVVDYLRAASDQSALARAGLRGAEDLFAPVSESVRNRWPWLAFNLLTAFAASRVIGAFEETITRVVALAALMPIVASIGGNTGNQTVALVIRALALDQLRETHGRLAAKEAAVGALNGVTWGMIVGAVALVLYHSLALSLVMATAIFLNLIVAALAGVAVPLLLRRTGRDPAQGASVLLTFVTDAMGFLLFLGLATAFLR
ncbi:MAG TPA: magnesium transporter [Vicinamibacterales bacterium]|nr:magnesium transporter [Vicinamibacterales bacterium]